MWKAETEPEQEGRALQMFQNQGHGQPVIDTNMSIIIVLSWIRLPHAQFECDSLNVVFLCRSTVTLYQGQGHQNEYQHILLLLSLLLWRTLMGAIPMVTVAQSAANWRNTHTHVDRTRSLTHLHQHSYNHVVRSTSSAIIFQYMLGLFVFP